MRLGTQTRVASRDKKATLKIYVLYNYTLAKKKGYFWRLLYFIIYIAFFQGSSKFKYASLFILLFIMNCIFNVLVVLCYK